MSILFPEKKKKDLMPNIFLFSDNLNNEALCIRVTLNFALDLITFGIKF